MNSTDPVDEDIDCLGNQRSYYCRGSVEKKVGGLVVLVKVWSSSIRK